MLTALNRNNPAVGSIAQIIGMARSLGNPTAMFQQMLSRNPELQQTIRACGGDYRQAFYKYAGDHGVDPNEILKQIQ